MPYQSLLLILGLFYGAFSVLVIYCWMVVWLWKTCRRKWFWPILRYSHGIHMDGLRKPQTPVSHDSKLGPPKYKWVLTMTFGVSVLYCIILLPYKIVVGPRMACLTVQQQLKWNPSGWDGAWQNYPDYCSHHIPDGEKESEWTIPHHCASLVCTFNTERKSFILACLKLRRECCSYVKCCSTWRENTSCLVTL